MAANRTATAEVTAEITLPDLFARHPQSRAVFDRYGLHGRTLARRVSVGQVPRSHGVAVNNLLMDLNAAAMGVPALRP